MSEHVMSVGYLIPGDLGHLIVACDCGGWHWHITDRGRAPEMFERHLSSIGSKALPDSESYVRDNGPFARLELISAEALNAVPRPELLKAQFRKVIGAVATYYQTTPGLLMTSVRDRGWRKRRKVMIYIAKQELEISDFVAAALFGTSPQTIAKAISHVKKRMHDDELENWEVNEIHSKVKASLVADQADVEQKLPKILPPLAQRLITATAVNYGVTVQELLNNGKSARIVLPRQVAMYLLRNELGLSYPKIGELLHKDHSTVMHGVRKVTAQMSKDDRLQQELAVIVRTSEVTESRPN